jgi:hypothetical protein
LEKFDNSYRIYQLDINGNYTIELPTFNPWLAHLNYHLNEKIKSNKYIIYTAWNVHSGINMKDKCEYYKDISAELFSYATKYNKNEVYDFIHNNCMDWSTGAIGSYGSYGYAAGGAEPVNSSLITIAYEKDKIGNFGKMNFGVNSVLPNVKGSFPVKYSNGTDHPYKLPYRIFWDYDHEKIVNGAHSNYIGEWDKYIDDTGIIQDKNPTAFIDDVDKNMRIEYINASRRISGDNPLISADYLNPLQFDPFFLVLEKDLLEKKTLFVTIDGNGQGSVTSSDTFSIKCSNDQGDIQKKKCSSAYSETENSTIELTATLLDDNSIFAGWSGPCQDTMSRKCLVTMSNDQFVTALFAKVVTANVTTESKWCRSR